MYVKRDIRDDIERLSKVTGIVAVVGPRQSGKTTLLRKMMPKDASYVLFDDPVARRLFEERLEEFAVQYIKDRPLAVLDEVQYCSEAGTRLKYLVDMGSKLWVTSSSEVLLGRDVLSFLVGRVSVHRLLPFNLREFLRAKGQRVLTPEIEEDRVREHMTFGGYPNVVLAEGADLKAKLLTDLHLTMVLRDMARTFSIRNLGDIEWLSLYLAQDPGAPLKIDDLASHLGVSRPTVKKYLDAMEKSYLIHLIRPFYTNKRKELVKQQRVYFLDTGMRNAIAKEFQKVPTGHLFENYVMTELLKMGFAPKYWRTKSKAEVDFVVEKGGEVVPIEVKLHVVRKVGTGLRSFIDRYTPETAIVVGLKGEEGSKVVKGCEVRFLRVASLWREMTGEAVTEHQDER
jgi:predicted AAA+ superfamily ATPase